MTPSKEPVDSVAGRGKLGRVYNLLQHTPQQRFVLQKIQPGLVGLMDGSV